ncbi:hypothetical protein F2Q69_00013842 [Brassica cretica]|uniref:Uncharacterized protein n=1 Tax=Brassica cretica TaxID=69181 RepID=A0A8S9QRK1_BRACR|nr:hypothetical protein F2Q69_00013842 [Brassica cretica]
MGLDEAFIKIGMTMGHHGRLVFNLIDQEMDGMKLVGQEMKWVICFKLKSWTSIHVPERQGVTTRPNWLIEELVGLIHEVLDREKAMGLDEAFIKIGMTMGHHGRLVFNLIDQEMDGMKLVGQEMKWVIWYDREMDCSNRNVREMSWKWKMKHLRRYLVGPGTRWIEPKQELFEKGLYRPKKWKDKPAWIMIGSI